MKLRYNIIWQVKNLTWKCSLLTFKCVLLREHSSDIPGLSLNRRWTMAQQGKKEHEKGAWLADPAKPIGAVIVLALVGLVLILAMGQTGGGVNVKGDWTIEVRNADGTLAHRRDFTNRLADYAPRAVANILGHQRSSLGWRVDVSGGTYPCGSDRIGNAECTIHEAQVPISGNVDSFPTLTVEVPTEGDDRHKLVLSGEATVLRDGTLTDVRTSLYSCPSDTAAGVNCAPGSVRADWFSIVSRAEGKCTSGAEQNCTTERAA
jgi:hypothetical protein